jgi:hypothetical protein
MNRDDAITVTEMVLNAWATPQWSESQVEMYVSGLMPLDAAAATKAVILAQRELARRPSIADLRQFYSAVRASEASSRPQHDAAAGHGKLPGWVKRWVCARYLFTHFRREQDMRRFPEQDGHVDPTSDPMPPHEWGQEAERITDAQALTAILSGTEEKQ